jgi:hypothetical protein
MSTLKAKVFNHNLTNSQVYAKINPENLFNIDPFKQLVFHLNLLKNQLSLKT